MLPAPAVQLSAQQAQRGLLAEVVFGNPKNGCRNLGVCKMHIGPRALNGANALKNKDCGCAKAIAFLRNSQAGFLQIHFLNYSLSTQVYQQYFSEGTLALEVPFALPAALNQALGLGSNHTFYLQPGHFPSSNDGLYHSVSIPYLAQN